MGRPDIWAYIEKGVPNLSNPNVNTNFGWVLFKREWVGIDVDDFYSTGVSNHTDGQGVLAFSSSLNNFIYLIKGGTNKSITYIKEDGSSLGFVSM